MVPVIEALPPPDSSPADARVDAKLVLDEVIEGVALANKLTGNTFSVLRVRFVAQDSPVVGVYRIMAMAITEAAAGEELEAKYPARFQVSDRVRVVAPEKRSEHMRGRCGEVAGRAQNDDGGWSYAVSMDGDLVWSFMEEALEPADSDGQAQ